MDTRFALALKYYDAELPREAWEIVREMLVEPSPSADVLALAAALTLQLGDFDQGLTFCDRILVLRPDDVSAWLMKAQALFHSGRSAEADEALSTASDLPGTHPAGWNNLGNLLDELGRPADAQAALARAISQAPDFSLAHNNLGTVLAGQGLYAAAAAAHRKALACDPDNLAAMNNLGVALLEQGLASEAVAIFENVLARDPGNRDAADNRLYAMIYTEDLPRAVYAAHAAWGRAQGAPPALDSSRRSAPSDRLRVGYVSPDFRRHSVSFFFEPLLKGHDAGAVEVFCYADVAHADKVTGRLKAAAHHWRDVHALRDTDILKLIQDDRIDVLVDLAGHTKGNRLGVFAQRAAPVQISALGYPATTGLPAMDYRLCDGVTDPHPEGDSFAVEALVRIAPGMHCYAPPHDAPDVMALPAKAQGHVTFGAFNKLAKISPDTIRLWSEVLKAIPTARLLIKTKPLAEDTTKDRVFQVFADEGITPDRLTLQGWLPDDTAHLDLYNRVDIALDTVPYNGTTTTCEALWMGVPVLTLMGQSHAGRVGASLLSQVGLKEWVAATPEDFVQQAVRGASDLSGLGKLRAKLRAQVAASPLCDGPRYAGAVEDAYRRLWRNVRHAPADQ